MLPWHQRLATVRPHVIIAPAAMYDEYGCPTGGSNGGVP